MLLVATAYILSWRLLWTAPTGSDIPFHLGLVSWVATSFPAIHWWYSWDGGGIPYRLGYPLAAHWLAVAVSRAASVDLNQGVQLVQFAVNPLCALGVYAYCAWRFKQPLGGLAAGVLYLLSPMAWTFLVDWGFFPNQVGTVLFMPCLIALDWFYALWLAGERTAWLRLAAILTMGLTALLGQVAPSLVWAPLVAAAAYALAVPGARRALRWLVIVTPSLAIGTILLAAFWALPLQDYLAFVSARQPRPTYSPSLQHLWSVGQVFQLSPVRLTGIDTVYDRTSLAPAAWIPALAGCLLVAWDRRVRVLLALVAFGVLSMTFEPFYSVTYNLPLLPLVIHFRVGMLFLQFCVPILGGLGLFAVVPRVLAALTRGRPPGRLVGAIAAGVLAFGGLLATVADVSLAARPVAGSSNLLAYGSAGYFDPRHIWGRRSEASVESQLIDPTAWRPLRVGCYLPGCALLANQEAQLAASFNSPPQRAALDAHTSLLLQDVHRITGGGQAYGYNYQLLGSPELADYVKATMVEQSGATSKQELATVAGIDSVALSPGAAALTADYRSLGWVGGSGNPAVFTSPSPSALAEERPGGLAVLVVGADQSGGAHPYNDLIQTAVQGMLPYSAGWLLRGRSPYVDDYSTQELSRYKGLLLVGYRYHDREAAWSRLDQYVRNGGSLYVETGWQFVDPDWNLGSAPRPLPVTRLNWTPLDSSKPVLVDGVAEPGWGTLSYPGGSWSASVGGAARAGAESVVSVGGKVVAARWTSGQGRVFWSGMNLIAHARSAASADEARFIAGQWRWLLQPAAEPALALQPRWTQDDEVSLDLQPSPGPTWILLKESEVPGWSAELRWPGGSRAVEIQAGELDYMASQLDSVPAGAVLVYHYGPTLRVMGWWGLSALTLALLALWLALPAVYRGAWSAVRRRGASLARATGWLGDDD